MESNLLTIPIGMAGEKLSNLINILLGNVARSATQNDWVPGAVKGMRGPDHGPTISNLAEKIQRVDYYSEHISLSMTLPEPCIRNGFD